MTINGHNCPINLEEFSARTRIVRHLAEKIILDGKFGSQNTSDMLSSFGIICVQLLSGYDSETQKGWLKALAPIYPDSANCSIGQVPGIE